MSARSEVYTEVDLDPSDLAQQTHAIARYFGELALHGKNHVVAGGIAGDPSTGSSQLTGTGNTDWNVDITAVEVIVDGVVAAIAAQTDYDIHSGSFLTGFVNGASAIAAIIAKNVAGTISLDHAIGTPATTGSQLPPTDAAMQAAAGAGNSWVKLFECTLNRTGDTTVTESQDNSKRPILGVTVGGTSFGAFSG